MLKNVSLYYSMSGRNEQSKKLIVVTGGAGFIGSHLCERLANLGYRVISLDNYFTGSKQNHVAGVEYREGHTRNIETLIPETPDIVYHLGEYSRTAVAMEEPAIVLDFNMVGTEAVLEFCRARKSKMVYAGSSTKFSDPREDGTPGRDLSPYTWSKAVNTELVRNYNRWYGLLYATVYFYNVYGPRELSGKYGTAVEIFREQYRKNEPLTVNSPGTQTRRYTHVLDTVDALVLVGEQGEGDEYGIASNDEYSTLELAKLFSDNLVMMPARRTSRPGARVDTAKIQSLGWKQQHTLKKYIESVKAQMR